MAVETNREARDFRANLTYLSGDLLGNDAAVNFETDGTNAASRLDNAYHVLTGANGALLDGFVIVGGYANWGGSNPDITETAWGGGMLVKGSSPVVSNCVFTCNYGYLGGGACVVKDLSTPAFPRFAHCVFSGNWAVDGSAVYDVTSGTYDSCRFAGGDAVGSGGALYFLGGGMPQMVNCILAGNESYFDGAIRVDGGTGSYTNNKLRVVNCTIALNTAQDPNGAVFVKRPSAPTFVNTILWDDTDEGLGVGEIGLQLGGSVILGYCDVEGGVDGIIGGTVTTNGPVLNDDPRFLPPVAGGPWTAVGTYDLARRQTALTVAGSSWTPGAYAGRFINPNVSQRKQFLVYTNTADSVTVWGDADLVADTGNSFRIQNFEIARGSPCVNQGTGTGAPAADIRGEARPRGLAHDIGAYEVEPPAEVPSATVLIVQ
jgi:hypothetical protein